MLIEVKQLKSSSVERLNVAWAQLYRFDVSVLPEGEQLNLNKVAEATSLAGRVATVTKLNEKVLRTRSQIAGIETSDLYNHSPAVLDCTELKQLAEVSLSLYQQLFKLYVQYAASSDPLLLPMALTRGAGTCSIPDIAQFAEVLEPALLKFQAFHQHSRDWRAIGFLTTQLNFCNQWLLRALTTSEQCVLAPYLQFAEENVAHPWLRVCAAGANYQPNSPVPMLVERMIPLADTIAQDVYQQLAAAMPTHVSRRGMLKHPGVQHSCVRDLKMFQAYLWLCVMEQDMTAIESELVRLCLMVFPSIGVKWELINCCINLLISEVSQHLTPQELSLISPYLAGMQQAFVDLYYPEAKF